MLAFLGTAQYLRPIRAQNAPSGLFFQLNRHLLGLVVRLQALSLIAHTLRGLCIQQTIGIQRNPASLHPLVYRRPVHPHQPGKFRLSHLLHRHFSPKITLHQTLLRLKVRFKFF